MVSNQEVVRLIRKRYKNLIVIDGYEENRLYKLVKTIKDFPITGITLNLQLDERNAMVFRFRKLAFFDNESLMNYFERSLRKDGAKFTIRIGAVAVYIYPDEGQEANDIVSTVDYVVEEINLIFSKLRAVLVS